eukprot:gene12089-2689_t
MTDLSSKNCLVPQVHNNAAAQSLAFKGVQVQKDTQRRKHEYFIVVSNSRSCRHPNICARVNDSGSQGFVHKSFVAKLCNQHSLIEQENKDVKYFSLLKEYVTLLAAIKSLINELESIVEGQSGDDEGDQRNNNINNWDLSKVHNILERYRSDRRQIKRLEIRFRSFLKSEMPYLSNMIGLKIHGLFRFVQCAENDLVQNIYMILNKELINLPILKMNRLLTKDTIWKTNCILLFQLASKIESISSQAIQNLEKWENSWKDRVAVFVSKRGGVRSQFPFLYLKNLSQPFMLFYIHDWLISVGISQSLKTITCVRAAEASKQIISLLYSLLFGEDQILKTDQNQNGQAERFSTTAEAQNPNSEMSRNHEKGSNISTKQSRCQLFQELWELGHRDEQLLAEFVGTAFKLSIKPLQVKEMALNVHNQKHSSQETNNPLAVNGILDPSGKRSSPAASKKVHWGDLSNSTIDQNVLDSHLHLLWQTLSEKFVEQITTEFTCIDTTNHKWDFPISLMDPTRAGVVMSCLSVKKLKSDSGEINPAFKACARSISAHVLFSISLQRWDQVIRTAQASAIKDKCRLAPNAAQNCTETMSLIMEAVAPMQSIFELLASSRGMGVRDPREKSEYDKLQNITLALLSLKLTMRVAVQWLQSKSQQFTSSGSWEQYHVITNRDAEALQEKLRPIVPHFITVTKKIHLMDKPKVLLFHELQSIQDLFSKIKAFGQGKVDVLVSSIKSRSRKAIEQHFPEAKLWRKRGSARIPFEPNLYIKVTPRQVLLPIVESLKLIGEEEAEQLVCKCFSVFVTALMEHILEESIKFSHFGANQLRLDFTCFRDWVGHDALHLSNTTVSSILSSNAFVDFDAAITLLCCQPESRRRSNFGSDSDNSASIGSSTSQGSYNGSFYESTIREIGLRNKDQWLALRMKNGQSKSKLLCITPT